MPTSSPTSNQLGQACFLTCQLGQVSQLCVSTLTYQRRDEENEWHAHASRPHCCRMGASHATRSNVVRYLNLWKPAAAQGFFRPRFVTLSPLQRHLREKERKLRGGLFVFQYEPSRAQESKRHPLVFISVLLLFCFCCRPHRRTQGADFHPGIPKVSHHRP